MNQTMPIDPTFINPTLIASIITIVVAFALMYFFTLLDKRDIFNELDAVKSRLDFLEKTFPDFTVASNLASKGIMRNSDRIKELSGVISNIQTEINSIQERITSLRNEKK